MPVRPLGDAARARCPSSVTPDTIRTRWSGERLDLDLALTSLLANPDRTAGPASFTGR